MREDVRGCVGLFGNIREFAVKCGACGNFRKCMGCAEICANALEFEGDCRDVREYAGRGFAGGEAMGCVGASLGAQEFAGICGNVRPDCTWVALCRNAWGCAAVRVFLRDGRATGGSTLEYSRLGANALDGSGLYDNPQRFAGVSAEVSVTRIFSDMGGVVQIFLGGVEWSECVCASCFGPPVSVRITSMRCPGPEFGPKWPFFDHLAPFSRGSSPQIQHPNLEMRKRRSRVNLY